MINKAASDARIYSDVQGLEQLHGEYKKDPKAVTKEVARQFESILMQMVMRSMRDANKAFRSDLLSTDQMDMYQDMFDKQLSLSLSDTATGLAETIERTLGSPPDASGVTPISLTYSHDAAPFCSFSTTSKKKQRRQSLLSRWLLNRRQHPLLLRAISFNSPQDFVKQMWAHAKTAAETLGGSPLILLAQAALETNWGKNVITHADGSSSHNLFNIKAGSNWKSKAATAETLEQQNGLLVKEKTKFRSYHSFMESFTDYVKLLKQNARYEKVVKNSANPVEFAQSLQESGYATDQHYADKVLKVFSSPLFQSATKGLA